MKKLAIRILPLFVLAIFMTACPYSSTVPLNAPSEKVDRTAKLTGKWTEESEDENPVFYEFKKSDENTYEVVKNEWNSTDEVYGATNYVMHTTSIDGTIFLNMKDGETYYFYKLEMASDGKSFKLYEVTDNIDETFSVSTQMYDFFKRYKDLSFFYNSDEKTYTKE